MATNGTAPTTGDLLRVPSGVARLRYFYGQLLTQRDLHTEQRYHLGLRRLMQRETFGTGTVAGLRVDDAGSAAQGSVFVRAGLAMDPDGKELLLVNDVCVTVADPASPPGAAAAYVTHTDLPGMANDVSTAWQAAFGSNDLVSTNDPGSLWNRLEAAGLTEVATDPTAGNYPALAAQLNKITVPASLTLKPGQLLRDVLFDALVGTTYLGLRYVERGTEPSPAVLDASCCGDATCFPSREEEGVVIVAQSTPFDPVPNPYGDARAALEESILAVENPPPGPPPLLDCDKCLCDYLLGAWRGLPADDPCGTATPPVVPIAVVYWSRFPRETAGQSRILSVDNCSRMFAPGVPPVRALFDAITQCTPSAPGKPRFDLIRPLDRAVLAPDTGGLTATVRARATSLLKPIPAATWEVYFYPAPPGATPVAPAQWNSASLSAAVPQPQTAYGITIQVTSQDVPSPLDPTENVTEVDIQFSGAVAGTPVVMPSGAYLWRLNLNADIQASHTGAAVAGVFEAVFYVP